VKKCRNECVGAACTVSWHVLGFRICFGGVSYSHAKSIGPKTKKKRKKGWDNVGKVRACFLVPFSQEVVINMLVLHIMYLMLRVCVCVYVCLYVLGVYMKES